MASSPPIPETLLPILCLLDQLEALLDDQSSSSFYTVQPHDDIHPRPDDSHGQRAPCPIQVSFSLLPFFMFHHDNPGMQKDCIDAFLRCCKGPNAWNDPLQAIGLAISRSIQQVPLDENTRDGVNVLEFKSSGFESGQTVVEPSLLVRYSVFSSKSIYYQTSLLSFIRLMTEQRLWATLPLSTSLTGALFGARGGFGCLPLVWRYLFNQYLRVSPSTHESEPVLDWNIKMVKLWSGVHIYRKNSNEGPKVTMASKTVRTPTTSIPQPRG